jgi:hypothetical protein
LLLKSAYKLLRYLRMRLFVVFLAGVFVYHKLNPIQKGSSTAQILLIVGAMLFLISLFYFAKALTEKERGERKKKEKSTPAPAPTATTVTLQSADGQTIPIVVAPPQQGGVSIPAYQPMAETQTFEGRDSETFTAKQETPRYYRVAQNPKYVMAEYSDRVELFYDSPRGLKYVRTDYKNS